MSDYNVVVGVSGGIAAYKSLSVISALRKKGCEVRVVVTENALKFVTLPALTVMSDNYVLCDDDFDDEASHIDLAEWGNAFLIVPATANVIGKIAHGIADDALTTTAISFDSLTKNVIMAPAMNSRMWNNVAVTSNIKLLNERGWSIIEPACGELACGEVGYGKLASTKTIVDDTINTMGVI